MQRLSAPAKLTVSLRIVGVRPDGYHLLDAEMVGIDLADTLEFEPGHGVQIVDEVVGGTGLGALKSGAANLVTQALADVQRRSAVRLVKRIPLGAGLGGGSADAAAVLRWAGCRDPKLALRLGADVPFCMVGGRARVGGVGEQVEPLPFESRRLLLVLPPLAVDTAAAYAAWDTGARLSDARGRATGGRGAANDLEAAALAVVPALEEWRAALAAVTGARPQLAGSGAAWFVDDDEGALAERIGGRLEVGARSAPVLSVRTMPPHGAAGGPAAPAGRGGAHATLPPGGAGVSVET